MKTKYGQNTIIENVNEKIVTTMTKLQVYRGSIIIGEAGITRASDFDFDALYSIAMAPSKLTA